MTSSLSVPSLAAMKRVFVDAFTAADIAEPLASFDGESSSAAVRAAMDAGGLEVAGIRRAGRIAGYVSRTSLDGDECGCYCLPVESSMVLDAANPLLRVLIALNQAPFVFVALLGSICGIVTHADLQKPPVRMWLFGLVILIELRFTD